jgi:hypothetical protein
LEWVKKSSVLKTKFPTVFGEGGGGSELVLELEELRAAKRVIVYFVLAEIIKQQSVPKIKRF